MKYLIIAAVIAVLVIAGFAITLSGTAVADEQESAKISCSSCGNSCSADSNCGLATCGAVNGKSCGCGKG